MITQYSFRDAANSLYINICRCSLLSCPCPHKPELPNYYNYSFDQLFYCSTVTGLVAFSRAGLPAPLGIMSKYIEDYLYARISQSPEWDSSGILNYTINVPYSNRDIPFKPDVQMVIVSTMVYHPNEWNETKLHPVIESLLGKGRGNLTSPMIGAVARYIKEQGQIKRPDPPQGRDPEADYWGYILSYNSHSKQYADSFIAQQNDALEKASASTKVSGVKNLTRADTLHYTRFTLDPKTYEILYKYTTPKGKKVRHWLSRDLQKLVMCYIYHLGWKAPKFVAPVGVMFGQLDVSTGPMINQAARYIYDQSQNPQQTHAKLAHWTTIISYDPAWEQYAVRFDGKTSRLPRDKPALEPVQMQTEDSLSRMGIGGQDIPRTGPGHTRIVRNDVEQEKFDEAARKYPGSRLTSEDVDERGRAHPIGRQDIHRTGPGQTRTVRNAVEQERFDEAVRNFHGPDSDSASEDADERGTSQPVVTSSRHTERSPSLYPHMSLEAANDYRENHSNRGDVDRNPTTNLPARAIDTGISQSKAPGYIWYAEKPRTRGPVSDDVRRSPVPAASHLEYPTEPRSTSQSRSRLSVPASAHPRVSPGGSREQTADIMNRYVNFSPTPASREPSRAPRGANRESSLHTTAHSKHPRDPSKSSTPESTHSRHDDLRTLESRGDRDEQQKSSGHSRRSGHSKRSKYDDY